MEAAKFLPKCIEIVWIRYKEVRRRSHNTKIAIAEQFCKRMDDLGKACILIRVYRH